MGRTHPNVKKIRDQKRKGRRAYLTSVFSLVHTPRTIGKSSVPESARPLFDYRKRFEQPGHVTFMSAILPPEWHGEAIGKMVVDDMISTRHADDKRIREALAQPPRVAAQATFIDTTDVLRRRFTLSPEEEEKIIELTEHVDQHDIIMVRESQMMSSRMSFIYNSKYTHCYFLETFYRPDGGSYIMKSITYEGRDRATFMMEHPSKISWVEHLPLPSLISVLPRPDNPQE